jgi:DNA-binding beta-propeller fold protein YncE
VDNEAPNCPLGGPIVRVTDGKPTIVAQGGALKKPRGNAVDQAGNLIVADGLAGLLKVDLKTGAVAVIVAKPPWQPRDVVIDGQGDYIVVDWPDGAVNGVKDPRAVYKITPAGQVTIIAKDPPLQEPHGVALDADGNIIVADTATGLVKVTLPGEKTVIAAAVPHASFQPLGPQGGPPVGAPVQKPGGPGAQPRPTARADVEGRTFAQQGPSAFAKPGPSAPGGPGRPLVVAADVRADAQGNFVVADITGSLLRVAASGSVTPIHVGPPFSQADQKTETGGPRGVVLDLNGDYIMVDENSNALLRVTPTGLISTIFSGAPLCGPADVTLARFIPPPSPSR